MKCIALIHSAEGSEEQKISETTAFPGRRSYSHMTPRVLVALIVCTLPLAGCSVPPPGSASQNAQKTPVTIPHSNRAVPQAASGNFDLYLLNLSWSPEYCHSHPNATECTQHDTFVLHGLWPENSNGTYPSACSSAAGPQDPSQYNDLYPDPGLLQHEWQTHGTCSGLSPDAYFQTVRSAYKAIAIPPALSQLHVQASMSPGQIQNLFHTSNPAVPDTSLVVTCGNNYLTAVEVCLSKSLQPVSCPAALHPCRESSVRIPAP